MSEAEYELVDVEIEEGGQTSNPTDGTNTTASPYPGFLRSGSSPAPGPPAGTVFVKTGGNALQAIDTSVLEEESVVRVIVPEGKLPGDSIMVQCPHVHGRYVTTTIPQGSKEGTEFLVRIPPLKEDENFSISDGIVVGTNLAATVSIKSFLVTTAVVSGVMLL